MKQLFLISLAILVNISILEGQVYIDPSAPVNGNGTMNSPYNTLDGIGLVSNTSYLFKRGTSYDKNVKLAVSNIVVDAYGTGARPVLINGMDIQAENCQARNLDIRGKANTTVLGLRNAPNCLVYNCEVSGGQNGIGIGNTYGKAVKLTKVEIHELDQEGVYIDGLDSLVMDSCYVHDVNLYYVKKIYFKATGDGLQISNTNFIKISNTTVDRSGTNNKFCMILQRCQQARIYNCNFIGSPQDDLSRELEAGMTCAYLSAVDDTRFYNCLFYSGVVGLWNQYSGNIEVHDCSFIKQESIGFDGALTGRATNCFFYRASLRGLNMAWIPDAKSFDILDCTFYQNGQMHISAPAGDTISGNTFYPPQFNVDSDPIDLGVCEMDTDLFSNGGFTDLKIFSPIATQDWHLYKNSTCFAEGYNLYHPNKERVNIFIDVNYHNALLTAANKNSNIKLSVQKYTGTIDTASFETTFMDSYKKNFATWDTGIYDFTIQENAETILKKLYLKEGYDFNEIDFVDKTNKTADVRNVFSADTVVYPTFINKDVNRKVVRYRKDFFEGYYLDSFPNFEFFYEINLENFLIKPIDPIDRYDITIVSGNGNIMHRQSHAAGIQSIYIDAWNDGMYDVELFDSETNESLFHVNFLKRNALFVPGNELPNGNSTQSVIAYSGSLKSTQSYNQASHELTIAIPENTDNKTYHIRVYNSSGILKFKGTMNSATKTFMLSEPIGLYVTRVYNQEQTEAWATKFIIMQ